MVELGKVGDNVSGERVPVDAVVLGHRRLPLALDDDDVAGVRHDRVVGVVGGTCLSV